MNGFAYWLEAPSCQPITFTFDASRSDHMVVNVFIDYVVNVVPLDNRCSIVYKFNFIRVGHSFEIRKLIG